jgi:hypothetical protein
MVRYALVLALSATPVGLYLLALKRIGFHLPGFIATTLASQPATPRHISLRAVFIAVVTGVDGACYATAGALAIVVGLAVVVGLPKRLGEANNIVRPMFENVWFGVGLIAVGVPFLVLVGFRVWKVREALVYGSADLAEVTEAVAGYARIQGSLWGDLASGRAARGAYLMSASGEVGRYYLQQRWALGLRQGDRIWVVRIHGKDALLAPSNPSSRPITTSFDPIGRPLE